MDRIIVAGIDGSLESRAAADWAAREAELRGARLRLVHVWEPIPDNVVEATWLGADTLDHWSARIPREVALEVGKEHPDLAVDIDRISGRGADVLTAAAKDVELLVLGSRALSGVGGFLVGSVGQAVVAHTETPVVLVRADGRDKGARTAATTGPVVLGLDATRADDTLLTFAFEEAARRGTALHVVRGWNLPPYFVHSLGPDVAPHSEIVRDMEAQLAEVLQPWRAKYPDVEVVATSRTGSPAVVVVDASRDAGLVVVGRRIRRTPVGPYIGPVAHAVLHHSVAPVAVVAHR